MRVEWNTGRAIAVTILICSSLAVGGTAGAATERAPAIAAAAPAPAGGPSFGDPLNISNPYHPFVPGAMKVYSGHEDKDRTVIVDLYLTETREFEVGAVPVATRILQETEFADGSLVEISRNFFAQADDGTVYYFGEIVDEYENGTVVGHGGSWLVGGASAPEDPPETADAPGPTVFMPASLSVGVVYKPEDLPPIVDETDTVKAVNVTVEVPAGRFRNAIRVVETTSLGDPPETKWYAPGIGVVKGRTEGEHFVLTASTFSP